MPSAKHWMLSSPIRTSLPEQSRERCFPLSAGKMSPKRTSLQLLKVFDGISESRPPSRSAFVSPISAAHSALPHYLQYRKNVDAQISLKAASGSELLSIRPLYEFRQCIISRGGTNQVPPLDMMPHFSCELLSTERRTEFSRRGCCCAQRRSCTHEAARHRCGTPSQGCPSTNVPGR